LTLAERWDGTGWTVEPTPNPIAAMLSCLYGASCTDGGACVAVGHYQDRRGRAFSLAQQSG
jgi:hypothetical protein